MAVLEGNKSLKELRLANQVSPFKASRVPSQILPNVCWGFLVKTFRPALGGPNPNRPLRSQSRQTTAWRSLVIFLRREVPWCLLRSPYFEIMTKVRSLSVFKQHGARHLRACSLQPTGVAAKILCLWKLSSSYVCDRNGS